MHQVQICASREIGGTSKACSLGASGGRWEVGSNCNVQVPMLSSCSEVGQIQVHAQKRPIIGINALCVQPMHNVNVPTHQVHLQTQYREIATLIGQNNLIA